MQNRQTAELFRKLKRSVQIFSVIPVSNYPGALLLFVGMAVYNLTSRVLGAKRAWKLLGKCRIALRITKVRFSIPLGGGDLGIIFDCLVDGMYETQEGFVPENDSVCLDIGANIGACSAVWYRRCSPKLIIAAEPHPVTCKRLRRNAALNEWNNLKVAEAAVSDSEGEITISLDPEGSMAVVGTESSVQKVVPMTTIDALTAQHKLTRVDLCKIDVEGHEMKVLEGAKVTLPIIRKLIIEYHTHELREAIRNYLSDLFEIVSCDTLKIGLLYAVNRRLR
jgi:FkbM family methyltransferase